MSTGTDRTRSADRIISSEGDDTLRGNGGNDVLEGGSGNDNPIGGMGDDIETDIFGDDVMKGGPGNDAIFGGSRLRPPAGQRGRRLHPRRQRHFRGLRWSRQRRHLHAVTAASSPSAGAGDDWMEAGPQLDLLVGDENNQFQDDPNGGHDVLIGGKGDDDYDSEGGDDIMVADVLGTERIGRHARIRPRHLSRRSSAGRRRHEHHGVLAPNLDELRDRFDLVEGVSGLELQRLAAGTPDRVADDLVGHELMSSTPWIARIAGLAALSSLGATSFSSGDIIMGGAGSDSIEGRAGDDILDGDRWLNVQLRAPVPNSTPARPHQAGRQHEGTADRCSHRRYQPWKHRHRAQHRDAYCRTDSGNIDTAVFTGPRANYTVAPSVGGSLLVTDNVGTDGVDRLWNIERLQFADQTVNVLPSVALTAPANLATVSGTAVVVSASVTPGTLRSCWCQVLRWCHPDRRRGHHCAIPGELEHAPRR